MTLPITRLAGDLQWHHTYHAVFAFKRHVLSADVVSGDAAT